MDSAWHGWRSGTLLPCGRKDWQGLHGFYMGYIAHIAANLGDFGDGFALNDIDCRAMLLIYNIFGNAECAGIHVRIPFDDYNGYLKAPKQYRKMRLEDGLTALGFSIAEVDGYKLIGYPKDPGIIRLLSTFAGKCSANKGNGFLAFLRCDLRELDKKTTVDLDFCLSHLSEGVRAEVLGIDKLMMGLKGIKPKRQITLECLKGDFWNGGTIKYVSKAGYCYTIHLNKHRLEHGGKEMEHNAWWTILPSYQGMKWHKMNDFTESALERLAESEPELAVGMFTGNYKVCTACYGVGCIGRTPYAFNGMKRITCHGRMYFMDDAAGFERARRWLEAVDEVLVG